MDATRECCLLQVTMTISTGLYHCTYENLHTCLPKCLWKFCQKCYLA